MGTPLGAAPEAAAGLPTRQRHALCNLLNKPSFVPQEIAALPYARLERAPGLGQQGMAIIRGWLANYGLVLHGEPKKTLGSRQQQRQRKLEQAIALLHRSGFEVQRRPAEEGPD